MNYCELYEALLALVVFGLLGYYEMKRKKAEREQTQEDGHVSDQGWGSFDPSDSDYGDGPDFGGF